MSANGRGTAFAHRFSMNLPKRLISGAVGAVALTALHELARRRLPTAPRMDLVGMRALRRLAPPLREPNLRTRDLHSVTLAGDLVSNSIYYAGIPASTPSATWTRAAVLGVAAGLGALLLPEPMGLGPPPHSNFRSNQVMTVAWYVAGALATAAAATAMPDGGRGKRQRAGL
jgi:hypothetical protein